MEDRTGIKCYDFSSCLHMFPLLVSLLHLDTCLIPSLCFNSYL